MPKKKAQCFKLLINAVNALIRPGPLDTGMTDVFIKRKRGFEPLAAETFFGGGGDESDVSAAMKYVLRRSMWMSRSPGSNTILPTAPVSISTCSPCVRPT